MRLLFSFAGGSGHLLPLLPVARAGRAQGHEVAFACQPAMTEAVARAGFASVATGGATLLAPDLRRPLQPLDVGAEERVIRDTFAGRIASERAVRLLAMASDLRPHVIVHDEVDFGAAVAAERLGVPHAGVIVLAAGGLIRPDLLRESLDALRAEHGLPADPHLAMLHRHLTLVPAPPRYRDPADPLPPTARHVRPAVLEAGAATGHDAATARTLARLSERSGRRAVYVTLGTVFGQESGDLFGRVLGGLAGLDVDVVVTVGHAIDPAELGPQPANVLVERFVPQDVLLPYCDAVVSHGGSGGVLGALAKGVPLVLLPLGADQPRNAVRCAALGVARVLDASAATAGDVAAACEDVLDDPSYRLNARELKAEAAVLPTAGTGAGWIAELAAGSRRTQL